MNLNLIKSTVRCGVTGEPVDVIVQAHGTHYKVFINGGLLCDGSDSVTYDTLQGAMHRHTEEVKCILGL